MVSSIMEQNNSSNHLYQGSSSDPPIPLHQENSLHENSHPSSVNQNSKFQCVGKFFDSIKLEIVAFIFTFSYVLPRILSSSMILDKVCTAHFQYPEQICKNLENYTTLKTEIEKVSTNYQLGHTLIQTAPAAILSCFLGPWSDYYGRKLPVIIAILGMTIDALGSTMCAHFLNSRVEYYYIPALFTGFSGGVVTNLAVVYSFASDMTHLSKRTMKYAKIEMATGFSIPLGVAAGGWIYKFYGYPAVFLLATTGLFFSLMGVVFLLPETRGLDNTDSWKVKLANLFSCDTFKASFVSTTKKRPHHGRKQILLLILSMCFIIIATNSTTDINFLFVHHQFNWGATEYSTITAIYSVFAIFLLILVIPAFKYFKAGDPTLGLVGTVSLIAKYVGIGLAFKPAVFHIANLVGLLYPCAPLAVRSRISKVVTHDDLGKVFSFVATAESLLPVLTTILISQIFNAFLDVYPGMPYITLAGFLFIPLSVFIWLTCLPTLNFKEIREKTEKDRDMYTSIDA